MFDFDAGKLMVIGVVALVVIGPKELPRVLRQVGQTVAKLRRMASDFQSQFMEAMREADMADVKNEMSKIAESAKIDVAFDPIRDIRNHIGGAITGETHANAPPQAMPALENAGAGIDLSALDTTNSPVSGALGEGGLVGAGIAPAPAIDAAPIGEDAMAPAQHATLADVRDALDETLGEAGGKVEDAPHRPSAQGSDAAHDSQTALKEHLA